MENLFLFLNKPEDFKVIDTPSIVDIESEKAVVTEPEKAIVAEPDVSVVKLKKKYNQSRYNKTFMEKNKDRIKLKVVCDICCGTYTYYNKSKHMKSIKHLNLLNKQNQK